MKVERLTTLRLEEFPNLLLLQVHTDEGLTGLGETYFGAEAVEGYVHDTIAPYLVGKDPLDIDKHCRALYGYLGFDAAGAETRGNSALDIALWDLLGRAVDEPIYRLVGGRTRDNIRIYNTCAGYNYARRGVQSAVDNWGLPSGEDSGPYEDLQAFLHHPGDLAQSLLDEGITGMKIWPFDPAAKASGGKAISARELDEALRPFALIRDSVGSSVDIMVELHALWVPSAARKIIRAVDDYDPFWYEDPIRANRLAALRDLARSTAVPIAASETLATQQRFKELLDSGAAGVLIFDVAWCGGISEAKKIASLADTYQVPVAPHDCTGPVGLVASTHLSVSLENALIQETVRAFLHGWYREIVTEVPRVSDGCIAPPEGAGLGTELVPTLKDRPDARVRETNARDVS